MIQLTNLCGVRKPEEKLAQLSCGTGKNAFANMYSEAFRLRNTVVFDQNLICRALTVEEIKQI